MRAIPSASLALSGCQCMCWLYKHKILAGKMGHCNITYCNLKRAGENWWHKIDFLNTYERKSFEKTQQSDTESLLPNNRSDASL